MSTIVPQIDPVVLHVRSALAKAIAERLEEYPTQKVAAEAWDISRARVSDIKHGKVAGKSTDWLVKLAVRAGVPDPPAVLFDAYNSFLAKPPEA